MSHLADPEDTRTTRVLLVAHSQVLLDASVGCLRRWAELDVVGAVRGADEALACVQDLQPHVIIFDLDVPHSAGLDMIPRLRALMPKAKVIGLALSNGNSYWTATLASGVDTIVSKGAMVQELLPAIRRVALRNPSPDVIGALAGQ